MSVFLKDILSQETQERPEINTQTVEAPKPSKADFTPDPIPSGQVDAPKVAPISVDIFAPKPVDPIPVRSETVEDKEEFQMSAEDSSEAMIDMIDVLQKGVFSFLGSRKLKKKIPDSLMETFIDLDIKESMGEVLTDAEKSQLFKYKALIKRMEQISKDVPFSMEEKEDLMNASIALVKKTGIKIPPGVWFGTQLASVISKRVIDLTMQI